MKWLDRVRPWVLVSLLTVLVGSLWVQTPQVVLPGEAVITLGPQEAYAAGQADYTVDGTDDDVQVLQALDALPVGGGKIVLLGFDYNFGTTVTRAIDNVIIEGVGRSTYISNDGVTPLFTAGGNNWKFSDLRTDAGGINMGATTGYLWIKVDDGTTSYDLRTPAGSIVNGAFTASSITDTGLTSGRVPVTGVGGLLGDDADLTFSGDTTTMTTANITTLNAPTGRGVTYVVAASNAPAHVKAQADYVVVGSATDEIMAAVAAGGEGSVIQLSQGTFNMAAAGAVPNASTIFLDNGQWLRGSGINSTKLVLNNSVQENGIGIVGKSGVIVSDLSIDGNKNGNVETGDSADGLQNGIYLNGGNYVTISRVEVKENIFHGILIYQSSFVTVEDSRITNNRFRGILNQVSSDYNIIRGNYLYKNGDRTNYNGGTYGGSNNGGLGVLQSSYVQVLNNRIVYDLGNTGAGAIDVQTTLPGEAAYNSYGILISGNIVNQTSNNDVPTIRVSGTVGGTFYDLQIVNNWLKNWQTWGILFDTVAQRSTIVSGNIIRDAKIGDNGAATESQLWITDNYILFNSTNAYMVKFTTLSNSIISRNIFSGAGNTNGLQLINGDNNNIQDNRFLSLNTYAINIDADSTGNRISGNEGDKTFVIGSATNDVYRNDTYITENSGTGTVNNGAVSANITHGLSITPTLAKIRIVGLEDPTNSVGTVWLSGATSSQFTVNVENDPGASNWDFGWSYQQ